jgi:hypothetical protein
MGSEALLAYSLVESVQQKPLGRTRYTELLQIELGRLAPEHCALFAACCGQVGRQYWLTYGRWVAETDNGVVEQVVQRVWAHHGGDSLHDSDIVEYTAKLENLFRDDSTCLPGVSFHANCTIHAAVMACGSEPTLHVQAAAEGMLDCVDNIVIAEKFGESVMVTEQLYIEIACDYRMVDALRKQAKWLTILGERQVVSTDVVDILKQACEVDPV